MKYEFDLISKLTSTKNMPSNFAILSISFHKVTLTSSNPSISNLHFLKKEGNGITIHPFGLNKIIFLFPRSYFKCILLYIYIIYT